MLRFVFKFIIVLSFCLIYTSCSNSSKQSNDVSTNSVDAKFDELSSRDQLLSPKEYVSWVQNPENGLKKEKIIDDMIFSAQYKPVEYVVCMEERTEELKDSILKTKTNELNEMQYFDLRIKLKDEQKELLKYKISSQEEYDKRVKYFAFQMQQDIQLVEGSDTLSCELFHFERAYDISPYAVFSLGFPIKNINSDKTFILYDKVFNKGYIKFTFKGNQLQNLPKIKTI